MSKVSIVYTAGQSITLAPGFHAQAGSQFLARISNSFADCNDQPFQEPTDNYKLEVVSNTSLIGEEITPEVANLKIAPNPFNQ